MNHDLRLGGIFRWRRVSRHGRVLAAGEFKNGVMLAGLDDLLDAGFRQQAQRTYHVGLIDLQGFAAISPSDTMAAHPGWVESTAYSGGRPQWSPGAPSGQSVVNGALFSFAMTADATVHGLFVATDGTKGGTAGVLWAAGPGDVDQDMAAGEVLQGSYTLTAAAGVGS